MAVTTIQHATYASSQLVHHSQSRTRLTLPSAVLWPNFQATSLEVGIATSIVAMKAHTADAITRKIAPRLHLGSLESRL